MVGSEDFCKYPHAAAELPTGDRGTPKWSGRRSRWPPKRPVGHQAERQARAAKRPSGRAAGRSAHPGGPDGRSPVPNQFQTSSKPVPNQFQTQFQTASCKSFLTFAGDAHGTLNIQILKNNLFSFGNTPGAPFPSKNNIIAVWNWVWNWFGTGLELVWNWGMADRQHPSRATAKQPLELAPTNHRRPANR